jgi:hypothetical protein
MSDYRQQQEIEEYQQWLADEQAQKEYQEWLIKKEKQDENIRRNIRSTETPF